MKKLKTLTINLLLIMVLITSVNLKIVNARPTEPIIFIENGELAIGSVGEVFKLDVNLTNKSKYFAKDIKISPQLDSELLELSDLLDFHEVKKLSCNKNETVSFNFRVKETAKPGVYPITFNIKFKNAANSSFSNSRTVYFKVIEGKDEPEIEVETVIVTPLHPKAGKEALYRVTITNTGERTASEIDFLLQGLTAESFTINNGINKRTLSMLKAGESTTFDYTLSVNKEMKTGVKAISYKITYKDEFGKDYNNESEFYTSILAKDDEGDSNKTIPKIILSKYKTSPKIVMSGANFNLDATFYNTNDKTAVKNIKITMTMKESDDPDVKTKNIFTPVNGTNVVYLEELQPRTSADCHIAFNVAKFAEAKTYVMVLKMEYEDGSGKQYKATEEIYIRVSQEANLKMDRFYFEEEVGLKEESWFNAYIYNNTSVDVYNILIKIEGENLEPLKTSYYLGGIDKYNGKSFDTRIMAMVEGKLSGILTLTYEDATGKQYEQKKPFDTTCVNFWEYYRDKEEPEDKKPDGTLLLKKILIGLVVGLVLLIAVVVFIKQNKKRKIKAFEKRIIDQIMKNQQ